MVGEVLEMVLVVQKEYMYLEHIFGTEDIIKQLPKETDDFEKITVQWIELTSRMASHGLVLPAALIPRMYTHMMSIAFSYRAQLLLYCLFDSFMRNFYYKYINQRGTQCAFGKTKKCLYRPLKRNSQSV